MSRQISKDYEDLCAFFKGYNLDDIMTNKEACIHLSACHKKYYAYLIIIEELRLLIDNTSYTPILSGHQFAFVQESCSDVGQALFLTVNGCYKGAKLLLRSSIENFLKGICYDEDNSIVTTKSVYEVFERAKVTNVFLQDNASVHSDLHDIYATLCLDVHTADVAHMASISALKHFPKVEAHKCETIQAIIKRLVNNYITSLALKFNQQYHHIGFENKEILNSEIKNKFKKAVQNIE